MTTEQKQPEPGECWRNREGKHVRIVSVTHTTRPPEVQYRAPHWLGTTRDSLTGFAQRYTHCVAHPKENTHG